jgi:hypothetical protein
MLMEKYFKTKTVPITAQKINGMKLICRLAHHDDAYLILCIYDQNDINNKILIMHMNEQIRLLCTWWIALG